MAENEKTSPTIAEIASKILGMKNPRLITDEFWEQIVRVAGSALTQTEDKKPVTDYMSKKTLKRPNANPFDNIEKIMQDGFEKN